jgi:RNA polymerase sigma-70 factor (ECF subfamily)
MPQENSEQSQWFTKYLQPHEAVLEAWLRNRFPSGLDIGNIVQEAFVCTFNAHVDGKLRSPKAFLFGTARNLALRSVRFRKIRGEDSQVQIDILEVLDESEDAYETIVRNQELEILTNAIQSLPDRCRQIFTLRKVYGLTQKEIAQQLEISTRTVNAQITIGLHKCARFVENFCKVGPG